MNKFFIKYLILTILITACKSNNDELKNTIPVQWKYHNEWDDYPDRTRDQQVLYLEIIENGNNLFYSYYEKSSKDSLPRYVYSINQLDSTLIDHNKKDTMAVSEIFHQNGINLMRFDFVNYPIHGSGCYIFSLKNGMLGHGRFHGLKWVLVEWNNQAIDFHKTLKKNKNSQKLSPQSGESPQA